MNERTYTGWTEDPETTSRRSARRLADQLALDVGHDEALRLITERVNLRGPWSEIAEGISVIVGEVDAAKFAQGCDVLALVADAEVSYSDNSMAS